MSAYRGSLSWLNSLPASICGGVLPLSLSEIAWMFLPTIALGTLAYLAFFGWLGVVFRNAILIGVAHVFLVEIFMGNVPGVLKQISISFEPDVSQEEANAKVQKFAEAVSSIRGCGDAARAAGTVGASVVDNNSIRVRDLPEQLQSAMLQLQVGQATPPFGSLQDGVRVLLLCGRDDPEVAEKPDFKQIMDQIENERIGKRAQRYLRDLRNDAIIEYN